MATRRNAIKLHPSKSIRGSENDIFRLNLEIAGYVLPHNSEERTWLLNKENCGIASNTSTLTREIVNDADDKSLPRVKILNQLKQIEEKPGFVIRNMIDPVIAKTKSYASLNWDQATKTARSIWLKDDNGRKIAFNNKLKRRKSIKNIGPRRGSRVAQEKQLQLIRMSLHGRAARFKKDTIPVADADNLASLISMGRDFGGKAFRNSVENNPKISQINDRIPIADAVIQVQKGHQPDTWDFTDIVDQDSTQIYDDYVSEVVFGRFVESSSFRVAVMVAILANTIITGLQTIPQVENTFGVHIEIADKIFLGIFTLEILTKWCVSFWDFWLGGWNWFDFSLVFISMIGEKFSFLRTGRLLRIFRVIRAVRSLRSLEFFTGMSLVVTTIASALPDMMNIIALCLIVMFIFAIIGVDSFQESIHLESLPAAFYSLFVVMTQDGWKDIYLDMKAQGLNTEVYFIVWIFFGAFLFSNLIIGVIVTNLERVTETEKIRKKFSHRDITKSVKGSKRQIFQQKKKLSGILSINSKNLKQLWTEPRPPQVIPKFTNMNLERFENILLIVVAIERALAERKNLRLMLMEVLDEIDVLNFEKMFEEEEDSDEGSNSSELMGDVLTRLIEQSKGWKRKRENIDRLEKINSERLKQWDEEFALKTDDTLLKAFEEKFCV